MRSFLDFDYINLAIVPLFLFSATFFPISQYPAALEAFIRITPLYQGVVLERSLVLGSVHWSLLLNAAYLAVMGAGRPPHRATPPRPPPPALAPAAGRVAHGRRCVSCHQLEESGTA